MECLTYQVIIGGAGDFHISMSPACGRFARLEIFLVYINNTVNLRRMGLGSTGVLAGVRIGAVDHNALYGANQGLILFS